MKNIYKYIFVFALILFSTAVFAAPTSNIFRTLLPETNNTYNIGSAALRWANGYFTNLDTSTITISGSVSGLSASQIVATDASSNLVTLSTVTYPSLTEISYVKGVTSAIQTQLGLKAPLTSPVFITDITTPLIIGGTAVGSNITYKSTTGIGTSTGIAHQWTGGTN